MAADQINGRCCAEIIYSPAGTWGDQETSACRVQEKLMALSLRGIPQNAAHHTA